MAFFTEGQKVWVEQESGEPRAGVFVGEAEQATWFGGAPVAYVAYPDTREGESVSLARITAREDEADPPAP
jgi:hypothetical protein